MFGNQQHKRFAWLHVNRCIRLKHLCLQFQLRYLFLLRRFIASTGSCNLCA